MVERLTLSRAHADRARRRRRAPDRVRARPVDARSHLRLTTMAFNNPPISWAEFERRLSGRPPAEPPEGDRDGAAWSRRRQPYLPPDELPIRDPDPAAAYAELHCHSNFSFLDGASHPEELVEEA